MAGRQTAEMGKALKLVAKGFSIPDAARKAGVHRSALWRAIQRGKK